MYSPETIDAARDEALSEMVKGFIWVVAGGLVTGVTYLSADTGGSYVVFWGAMAYGGFRILRSAYYWFRPEALIEASSA